MASSSPSSNRVADIRPGFKTQKKAPTLRQDGSRSGIGVLSPKETRVFQNMFCSTRELLPPVWARPNLRAALMLSSKGMRISETGSLVVNIPGLVAPAYGPPGDLKKYPILYKTAPSFIINPKRVCFYKPTELLVAVLSNTINFERRRRTRENFNIASQGHERIRLVFVLSTYPRLKGLQRKVRNESEAYGDIVQIKAVESYGNLTLKSLAILFWAIHHCSNASYVLKQDDDVNLSLPDVIRALREKSLQFHHFILGNSKLLVESPIRDELSKYYTSPQEFQDSYYPTFVHGPGYAFPLATGALLYQASLRTRLFWLEDVYITGLCAARARVPIFFDQRFVT
ncbi:beta-1,3-galactosyltransferase 1-like [Plakobranchus ocellatus]|uniref:Hexosyltransferase n=1 Tax=Plakobranchus ocellatus TaxID=259542 RepID=A0AAV4DA14_9GAST|nr:beta-1,3-galactosyltransferase 1-like [Plakobranchus ocellatus]